MRYKSNFVSSCKCYLKNRKKEAPYADTSSFEALFGCNPGDILKYVDEEEPGGQFRRLPFFKHF